MAAGVYLDSHYSYLAVMSEATAVLGLSEVSSSTAFVLYHRVVAALSRRSIGEKIDKGLVVTTCLYLASKVEEQPKKIRDVINVCHRLISKEQKPLEIGSTYWNLRDSVVSFELFLLRLLNFNVTSASPHKFLLSSLQLITDYLGNTEPRCTSLNHVAWALLKDLLYLPLVLDYEADLVAVSVIYMAMQIVGVSIPRQREWWKLLGVNCDESEIQAVLLPIFELYRWDNRLAVDAKFK